MAMLAFSFSPPRVLDGKQMASEAELQPRSSVLSCFLCPFEKPHKCNSIDFFALDWLQRRAHCTILIVVYFRIRSFLGKTIKLLWCESWQKKTSSLQEFEIL